LDELSSIQEQEESGRRTEWKMLMLIKLIVDRLT
jgi:hypothetical protein